MNTDNFLIEESEIEFAQNVCKLISDASTRNRAVANAFGARIAEKFFWTLKKSKMRNKQRLRTL